MPKLADATKAAPTKKAAPKKAAATKKAAAEEIPSMGQAAASWSGDIPPKTERAQNRPLDDELETLNVLYTGDGGSSKTTSIAAMAHLGRVLIINAESGVKARALRKLGIPTQNIFVRPDKATGEQPTFEMLEDLFWEIKADLEADPNSWAGIGWDSITEIHKVVLKAASTYRVAKALRTGKGNSESATDIADYGVMTEQMRTLIRRYRDLPCHFAASALMRRDKDDDGKVIYRPAVTPKLQDDLFGYMDIVCVTSEAEVGDEIEYQGLFSSAGKFRGKDRFNALPRRLVTPTFDRLVAYVNETLDVDSDPVMQEAAERRRDLVKKTPLPDAEDIDED